MCICIVILYMVWRIEWVVGAGWLAWFCYLYKELVGFEAIREWLARLRAYSMRRVG
jgi:hypothetical protein